MSIEQDKLIPKGVITLPAFYVVQYWDNWRLENNQYYPPTNREYAIHSGPYQGYLDAVLAIIKLAEQHQTAKYDILESVIGGKILGFDVDSGDI